MKKTTIILVLLSVILMASHINPLWTIITGDEPYNSLAEMNRRESGYHIMKEYTVTGTDNPVNFKVEIHFEYYPLDGGSLEFL